MRNAVIRNLGRDLVFADMTGPDLSLDDFHVEPCTLEHRRGGVLRLGVIMFLTEPARDALDQFSMAVREALSEDAWLEVFRRIPKNPWNPIARDGSIKTEYLVGIEQRITLPPDLDLKQQRRQWGVVFSSIQKPDISDRDLSNAVEAVTGCLSGMIGAVNAMTAGRLALSAGRIESLPDMIRSQAQTEQRVKSAIVRRDGAYGRYAEAKKELEDAEKALLIAGQEALREPLEDIAKGAPRIQTAVQQVLGRKGGVSPDLSC